MALDFPNSPTNNQSFSAGGKTWIYNGTKWVLLGVSLNQTVADGAITEAKIASNAVTTAKIAAGAVGTTDLAANAVTQAKLASNLSGITVTTTANRDTDIPSPFTGQFCFLTDTSTLQRYTGSAWVNAVATAPAAPTALSGTALGTTSVSIAFTPGADNGSAITNYQYALSTNSGSSYGSFLALDPADSTSPITISGLTGGTAYTIKLKAVNTMGAGTESAGVSVTTVTPLTVDYLVIAGGGGGGSYYGTGGGGAGGYLTNSISLTSNATYTVTVGGGGTASAASNGTSGQNSVFSSITALGGGYGAYGSAGGAGGSAGGSAAGAPTSTAGTAGQGFAGGIGTSGVTHGGGGGGGASANGANAAAATGGAGGAGAVSSIDGTATTRAGGGGGGAETTNQANRGAGGAGGGGIGGAGATAGSGTPNTGSGGGGGGGMTPQLGGGGGSGIVILRYPSAYTITLGAGLTGSTTTVSSNKVTTITAGSGNVSWA